MMSQGRARWAGLLLLGAAAVAAAPGGYLGAALAIVGGGPVYGRILPSPPPPPVPAGHRYWRISAVAGTAGHSWYAAVGATDYTTLWEIALSTTAGGANLALGRPATASSQFSAGFAAAYAVDGAAHASSRWASALTDTPQWIAIDLGAPRSIRTAMLTTQRDATSEYHATLPRRVVIAASDDGSAWTDVATIDTADAAIQTLLW